MDRLLSEQEVKKWLERWIGYLDEDMIYRMKIGTRDIPSAEPKKCKDCKWWRDSDGAYRRGVRAESQCPINRREVLEGNGYCYVFEPQESEG